MGNKCDMDESKRAVPFSKGQALADELGIPFFETSAKNNINVTEAGLSESLNSWLLLGRRWLSNRTLVWLTRQSVQVFQAIARDVMVRLQDTQSSQGGQGAAAASGTRVAPNKPAPKAKKSGCC